MQPSDIVAFWTEAGPQAWFAKSDAFDQQIREGFETSHHAAARGEMDHWRASAQGVLALLLLLDQFPRNLYRGSGHAFATDPLARRIACDAVDAGQDLKVAPALRPFVYLPFEHSEDLADQDRAMVLFGALAQEIGDPNTVEWAVKHRDIIVRFGRFPHRNAALGRIATADEQAFLDEGGFEG